MSEAPDPEVVELATKIFDLARQGETEQLVAYVDAGVPANLSNDRGDSLVMSSRPSWRAAPTRPRGRRPPSTPPGCSARPNCSSCSARTDPTVLTSANTENGGGGTGPP